MNDALKTYVNEQNALRTNTPVTVATPGRTDEVLNNTGGYTFEVSDRTRLERFLILGTDGGTYYVGQRDLTKQNVTFVEDLIKRDEQLVLDTVVNVSATGRAAKNSAAIFALALLLTKGQNKEAARLAVPVVARTATHLFELAEYVDKLGGWGRGKRKAFAGWYTSKDADQIAYQAVKYRQRNGWTHRDVFRLAHPVGLDINVGNFILGKGRASDGVRPVILDGFEAMQAAGSVKEVVAVLDRYTNLPWETIPTQFLKDRKVWEKLFYNDALGQTALLRNVTRFAKIGAFEDTVFAADVAERLSNSKRIAKGRVHPVAYANALGVYRDGVARQDNDRYGYTYSRIVRNKDWDTNPKVLAGLEAGFYNAFDAVEPAGKRTMVSIDVSASMTWGAPAGLVGMDYMGAAAAMAMVAVRTEPYVEVNAFSDTMQKVNISASDTLETVRRKLSQLRMSATDIGLPIADAMVRNAKVDTFQVYTDNEVNRGTKPSQLIKQYRDKSGRPARYAVVGMASTGFTVADPTDAGMMDFVGFDASAPRVMSDFSAGRL